MNIFTIIGLMVIMSGALATNVDKESGLIINENWELVKANCTGCHAAPHFTSQKNDREGWIEVIRLMQNKHGLWQFTFEMETDILNYLTKNYGFFDSRKVKKTDKSTGMIIDENLELVKANCTGCHSSRIIIQQGANRDTWLEIIRWMQEEQGLWQFDTSTENKILDYLAKNYSQASK